MMKNMMEKFASPPKNKAEKKKWDAGEKELLIFVSGKNSSVCFKTVMKNT